MIRSPLVAAFAAGFLWASGPASAADEPKPATGTGLPQTQKINELIAKGWESAGIKKPALVANNAEFMRRVFIDLIGRIPTPEEINDFEGDKTANKRAKLVYRLLNEGKYTPNDKAGKPVTAIAGLKKFPIDYNDAYAENFAELWATWMLTRTNTHQLYRTQFHSWLAAQFAGNSKYPDGKPWNLIVQEVIGASGKTNENGAVVFVLRHLGDPLAAEMGAKPNFEKEGKFDAVPVSSRVTKLFLGIQSQCVQCHNHPHNKEYLQSDFWGMNGFFRQTDRDGTTNPNARNLGAGIAPPQLTLKDVPAWNVKGITESGLGRGMVMYEKRDGQKGATPPTMIRDLAQFANGDKLSGKQLPEGMIPSKFEGKSRRQVLAQWVTEHDNFGKAFVNRMWGHLFGRGLNEEPSVDNFNSNNVVVHPELLDYLAEEFKKYNYDPKKLLEWICTSDVYNLSHMANKEYAANKFDPYFARMPLKALSPEVMFDSLAVATRAETRRDDAAYKKLKEDWGKKLTQNFGDDEGNEINFNGTVVQALLMMNGKEINGEIGSGKAGVIVDIVKKKGTNPNAIYDELFLMTLSRHPTKTELAQLEEVRLGKAVVNLGAPPAPKTSGSGVPPKGTNQPKGGGIPVPGAMADDVTFYQDVFWALLNSSEFMLNH